MLNAPITPRFVPLRTAARRLGVRDALAARELLWAAEADLRRGWDGNGTVSEADLDALVSVIR